MKNYLRENSQEPFPFGAAVKADEKLDSNRDSQLPEGWRRLPTGLRGSRLYHVTRPDGTSYWEGEAAFTGGRVCRRFASELHARAWLHLATEPRCPLGSVDSEEIHESSRAAVGLVGVQ